MNELVGAGLVVGQDAMGPEGTIVNPGVEDVHAELSDGSLGGVITAEGDRHGER